MFTMHDDHRPLPLKAHLVGRGIAQAAFADRIGISSTRLCSMLNRKLPITKRVALAVARELGVGLDEASLLVGEPSSWSGGHRALS